MSRYQSITATVLKEWLLLRRDAGSLLVLLVMPGVLILIMALVQDAPFRDYQDLHLGILVADEDGGALSAAIHETLEKSNAFHLTDSINGKPVSHAQLRQSLQHGKYTIGLIIPKGATAEVVNAANTIANSFAAQLGNGTLPQRPPRDSVTVRLLFDPVSRPAFRMATHAALDKAINGATTKLLLQRIRRLAQGAGDTTTNGSDFQKILAGLSIREEQTKSAEQMPKHINSVQHNVPAWAIFGMFFIVVPLSGHIIREREDRSALRVKLIPGASFGVAIGRIIANMFVCCLQFLVMCAVGKWLLPLAGLPALTLGMHPPALVPVVIATALCATAYGNLIGTFFRTNAQALPFGAISIVILSAMGGIWVPVELLPPALQKLANLSPLHWALEGVQAIILRDGSWNDILLPTLVLAGLAAALFVFGTWKEQRATYGI
jgi:ABC-2 type transport system permease protein